MVHDASERSALRKAYLEVRSCSEQLCESLELEDFVVQAMPDASPVKWHLAHTTWFFETFVVQAHLEGYEPFHPFYGYLFNSYYEQAGERHPRPDRGLLSRPTVADVYRYRSSVDHAMTELLEGEPGDELLRRTRLGIHHEQQHQELILTDIKTCLGRNPLLPSYRSSELAEETGAGELKFHPVSGGQVQIGTDPLGGEFHFDNEGPRHDVLIRDFEIANRLVTNKEILEFVLDGGYEEPAYWLSDGWAERKAQGWGWPEYWFRDGDVWREYTLHGPVDLLATAPATHVSFYEADAFARWYGARLPTEFEWEHATVRTLSAPMLEGESLDICHPRACQSATSITQLFGDCWQWTASAYAPYPGYRPPSGALGEYNP